MMFLAPLVLIVLLLLGHYLEALIFLLMIVVCVRASQN